MREDLFIHLSDLFVSAPEHVLQAVKGRLAGPTRGNDGETFRSWRRRRHRDMQCLRTLIGNESVPIQLAQCWLPGLAIYSAKILIYFSTCPFILSNVKHTRAILSNSTRIRLLFEITKMLIAV